MTFKQYKAFAVGLKSGARQHLRYVRIHMDDKHMKRVGYILYLFLPLYTCIGHDDIHCSSLQRQHCNGRDQSEMKPPRAQPETHTYLRRINMKKRTKTGEHAWTGLNWDAKAYLLCQLRAIELRGAGKWETGAIGVEK